jgi:hypothetical protein
MHLCGASYAPRAILWRWAVADNIKTTRTIESEVLRGRSNQVRARYDDGAMSPGVYQAVKQIELEIAWTEHKSNVEEA